MKVPLRIEERERWLLQSYEGAKERCVCPEVSTLVTLDYRELNKLHLDGPVKSGYDLRDLHW